MENLRTRLRGAQIQLVWTRSLCRRDPFETLRLALEGGVEVVQIREKEATARELYELARRLIPLVHDFGALLVVNDRIDAALGAAADGVHLGQGDLPLVEARRIAPREFLIGVSTHSLDQVRAAVAGGADSLGFGPLFSTATKPHEPAIGAEDLAEATRRAGIPVFAIGGLDPARASAIRASRVAVSSALLAARDPLGAARALRASLVPLA